MTASTENPTGQKLSEWLRARNKAPTIEDFEVYERRLEEAEAALAAPVVPEPKDLLSPVSAAMGEGVSEDANTQDIHSDVDRKGEAGDQSGALLSGHGSVEADSGNGSDPQEAQPASLAPPVVPERGQDERRWYLVPIVGPDGQDGQPAWRVRGPAPADSPSREIPVVADVSSPAYFPPGVARVVPARPLDDTERTAQAFDLLGQLVEWRDGPRDAMYAARRRDLWAHARRLVAEDFPTRLAAAVERNREALDLLAKGDPQEAVMHVKVHQMHAGERLVIDGSMTPEELAEWRGRLLDPGSWLRLRATCDEMLRKLGYDDPTKGASE